MGQKSSRLQPKTSQSTKVNDGSTIDAPDVAKQPSTNPIPSSATKPEPELPSPASANSNAPPTKSRRRSIQLPISFRPSSSRGKADKENGFTFGSLSITGIGGKKDSSKERKQKEESESERSPKSAAGPDENAQAEAKVDDDIHDGIPQPENKVEPIPIPDVVPAPLPIDGKPDLETLSTDVTPTASTPAPQDLPVQTASDQEVQPKSKTPRLRIAIVGGGIGGLSLATFLKLSHRAYPTSTSTSSTSTPSSCYTDDLQIDIYESAPSLTELGAGVGMWLRTWRIMRAFSGRVGDGDGVRVGVRDGGEKRGEEGENEETLVEGLTRIAPAGRDMGEGLRKAFEFRKGDSQEGTSFHTMEVPFGVLTLHRADFQQVLARHAIPPAQPHFGKRLANYTEDPHTGEVTLHFTDGTRATCDLLVGADGIRSVTRGVMYRRLVESGEVTLPDLGLSPPPHIHSEKANGDVSNGHAILKQEETEGKEGATKTDTKSSVPPSPTTPTTPLDPIADFVDPVWSGTLVYRALIPKAALDARWPGHRAGLGPVCYFGKSKHVLAFPIMHTTPAPQPSTSDPSNPGSDSDINSSTSPPTTTTVTTPMINLVAFTSQPSREGTCIEGAWVRPAPQTNLLKEFEGWEPEVGALLEVVGELATEKEKGEKGEGAGGPLLWAIHVVKPLPRYVGGKVVLVGDAAHAMTPHQGAGGGQAIEDAYVLAALLAHPGTTKGTLGLALSAYERVRIPVSQEVARKSRLNGMMYDFNAGPVGEPLVREKEEGEMKSDDDSGVYEGTGEVEGEREREKEREKEREMSVLKAQAAAVMKIHKWEWEEPAEAQPREAVRMFEEMLKARAEREGVKDV